MAAIRRKQPDCGAAIAYLQYVSIARTPELLGRTLTPKDQIAWEVDHSDPAAFRKPFQKLNTVAPSACRQRFGTA